AAENLLRLNCTFKAEIGEARLYNRGQKRYERLSLRSLGGFAMMTRAFHLQCRPSRERPARLDKTPDVEQHAANIGMLNDWYGIAPAIRAAPLQSLLRIAHRLSISCSCNAQTLHPNH